MFALFNILFITLINLFRLCNFPFITLGLFSFFICKCNMFRLFLFVIFRLFSFIFVFRWFIQYLKIIQCTRKLLRHLSFINPHLHYPVLFTNLLVMIRFLLFCIFLYILQWKRSLFCFFGMIWCFRFLIIF